MDYLEGSIILALPGKYLCCRDFKKPFMPAMLKNSITSTKKKKVDSHRSS